MFSSGIADDFSFDHPPNFPATQLSQAGLKHLPRFIKMWGKFKATFLVTTSRYGPDIRLIIPRRPAMGFLLATGGIWPLFAWTESHRVFLGKNLTEFSWTGSHRICQDRISHSCFKFFSQKASNQSQHSMFKCSLPQRVNREHQSLRTNKGWSRCGW